MWWWQLGYFRNLAANFIFQIFTRIWYGWHAAAALGHPYRILAKLYCKDAFLMWLMKPTWFLDSLWTAKGPYSVVPGHWHRPATVIFTSFQNPGVWVPCWHGCRKTPRNKQNKTARELLMRRPVVDCDWGITWILTLIYFSNTSLKIHWLLFNPVHTTPKSNQTSNQNSIMAYLCGVAQRNPISIRYRECKTELLGL